MEVLNPKAHHDAEVLVIIQRKLGRHINSSVLRSKLTSLSTHTNILKKRKQCMTAAHLKSHFSIEARTTAATMPIKLPVTCAVRGSWSVAAASKTETTGITAL